MTKPEVATGNPNNRVSAEELARIRASVERRAAERGMTADELLGSIKSIDVIGPKFDKLQKF